MIARGFFITVMPPLKKYMPLQVGLTDEDRKALERLAKAEGKKQGELAREAIRWYLKSYEKIRNQEFDNETSRSIRAMSNRLAGMLYRISVATQTLSEFQWLMLSDEGKDLFEECVTIAKQKLHKRFVGDERTVPDAMAKEIES